MQKTTILPLILALVSVLIAYGLVCLLSSNGYQWQGYPVLAICAAFAFVLNWLVYLPSNMVKSEKFYDLTGSLTYIGSIVIAVSLTPELDLRGKIIALLVVIWAVRLGSFLFLRILRDGKDDRFDQIKANASRFFFVWTLQALWVFITSACALTVLTSKTTVAMDTIGWSGLLLWLIGFVIEVVADRQKSIFRQNTENKKRFIQHGLWAWSRHPNYFGEILLWFGIALISLPVFDGGEYVALISPLFVYLLIRYVSGVNKLEQKADRHWGDNADYQQYKRRTPLLLLWPPRQDL